MSDHIDAESIPQVPQGPPYPVELIADLHAGVLPDDVAAALWPHVLADPDARGVVAALDATRSDLAGSPLVSEPPPPAVAAVIESTLAAIRNETTSAEPSRPSVAEVESIEDARDRYRDARRRRGMVIASVAAGIIAVVTLVIAVLTASTSSQGEEQRADSATTVVSAAPLSAVQDGTLLSYLGRTGDAFSGENTPQRLARCLAANSVGSSVQVVGSGPLTTDGRDAVVILLSTGVAGRFDALVVGPTCDTNTPATISRTTLGAVAPTR